MKKKSFFHLVHWIHQHGWRRPKAYYLLPPLLWAGLIAWGSLAPSEDLPKFNFQFADKVEHAAIYAVFGLLAWRGWRWRALTQPHRQWVTFGGMLLAIASYGLLMECLQWLTPHRTFDLWDALCNSLGAVAGMALWSWWAAQAIRHPSASCSNSPAKDKPQ